MQIAHQRHCRALHDETARFAQRSADTSGGSANVGGVDTSGGSANVGGADAASRAIGYPRGVRARPTSALRSDAAR